MSAFLHGRLQALDRLLESGNHALDAYTGPNLDHDALAAAFIDESIAGYHSIGIADAENEMLALKTQLEEARTGIDPYTRQRVTVRRREMQHSMAVHVVRAACERVRSDYTHTSRSLADLREKIVPLALYAMQKGLVHVPAVGALSQQELENLWAALLADENSQSAARQVAMSATTGDILLLLGDLILSVSSTRLE